MSAKEYRKVEDQLFVIHDQMNQNDLLETLEYELELSDKMLRQIKKSSIFEQGTVMDWFQRINDKLPAKKQATYHGAMNEPTQAAVWIAPESEY